MKSVVEFPSINLTADINVNGFRYLASINIACKWYTNMYKNKFVLDIVANN